MTNNDVPFSFAQGTNALHIRHNAAVGRVTQPYGEITTYPRRYVSLLPIIFHISCLSYPLSLCESTSSFDPRKLDSPKVWTPPTQLVHNGPRSHAALAPATSVSSEQMLEEDFFPFSPEPYKCNYVRAYITRNANKQMSLRWTDSREKVGEQKEVFALQTI